MDRILEMNLCCLEASFESEVALEANIGSAIRTFIAKAAGMVVGIVRTIAKALRSAADMIRSKMKRSKQKASKNTGSDESDDDMKVAPQSDEGISALNEVEKQLPWVEKVITGVNAILSHAFAWLTEAMKDGQITFDYMDENFVDQWRTDRENLADYKKGMQQFDQSIQELKKHPDVYINQLLQKMGALDDKLDNAYKTCEGMAIGLEQAIKKGTAASERAKLPNDVDDAKHRQMIIRAVTNATNSVKEIVLIFHRGLKSLM